MNTLYDTIVFKGLIFNDFAEDTTASSFASDLAIQDSLPNH